MILLIDNYDSFVYNLARYFRELGCTVEVARNDYLTVSEVERLRPEAIVLSPGPCTPREAGISLEIVRELGPRIPILGVCLGHQTIAEALGGEVVRASEPVHGRTSAVVHNGRRMFTALPNPLTATRYHSLIVPEATLPSCLRATARTPDGVLMAIEHLDWATFGLQFHPESVLTTGGHTLLDNFLHMAGLRSQALWDARELDNCECRERQPQSSEDWSSVGLLHW